MCKLIETVCLFANVIVIAVVSCEVFVAVALSTSLVVGVLASCDDDFLLSASCDY